MKKYLHIICIFVTENFSLYRADLSITPKHSFFTLQPDKIVISYTYEKYRLCTKKKEGQLK